MAKNCKGCKYYRRFDVGRGGKACYYCLDTGEVRGCSPENCTKKDRSVKNGQKAKEGNNNR